MRLIHRVAPILGYLLGLVACWYLVYFLIIVRDVGAVAGFWEPERIAVSFLFVAGPALTFIPIARILRIPLYDLEGISGWAMLLFVVTFVDPGHQPPLPLLLLFLLSLTVSLATLFTLISYAVGLRVFARRSQRYDFVRARREGYLLAMFTVGCLLLGMLDVMSPISVTLLGMIVALLEILLLSRGTPPRSRSGEPPR